MAATTPGRVAHHVPVDPDPLPDPAAPPAVELDGVTHRFGDVTALSDLSFEVPASQITVLLGPNGAGKTTAIRAITGALTPAVGRIRTFGLDPGPDGGLVRPRCGVVSAKPALYDRLSGFDNLRYSARLYEVPEAVGRTRDHAALDALISEAAARFGIVDALGHQVGGYSTGMKTRLALARAVLHRPDLLLFDEPTSGLDPESSAAVLELIAQMPTEGRTVVMCTHLLAEAEGLADHVVVMEAGHAVVCGAPEEISRRYWPGARVLFDAEPADQLDRMATWQGVTAYRRDDLADVTLDGLGRLPDLVASLVADGVRLTRVEPRTPTLEDLYFAVRRERRSQQPPASDTAPDAARATAVQPEEVPA